MLHTILKIGNILVLSIPVFLLASPNVRSLSKDLMDISVAGFPGRSLPEDLMSMFLNETNSPDDLQDCMADFSKCIGVHFYKCRLPFIREIPFCGTTVDGQKKNFTSICHLAYENCKVGQAIWQSTDDNKKYCEYKGKDKPIWNAN